MNQVDLVEPFDWEGSWLQGYEYEHMLRNVQAYSSAFGLKVYSQHPPAIYALPTNGLLYFLRGQTLTHDVVFSHGNRRHNYHWKKVTLVKRNTKIAFIVSKGTKKEKQSEKPAFRMFAVTLASSNGFILCHVRRETEGGRKIQDTEDENVYIGKATKKVAAFEHPNGLHTLLEVAASLQTSAEPIAAEALYPENGQHTEVDYVSLFHCPSVTKFPLFNGTPKLTFEVIRR